MRNIYFISIIFVLLVIIIGASFYFQLSDFIPLKDSGKNIFNLLRSDSVIWDTRIIGLAKSVSSEGFIVGSSQALSDSDKNIFIPVLEKTEIFSLYVLPENSLEKEFLRVTNNKGEIIILGGKKISLNEIKEGDHATVNIKFINSKGEWEATKIIIYPQNLDLN